MAMMARNRRHQQYEHASKLRRQLSISQMISSLDLQSMLLHAPSTSVRQTIDVERLEDEIVSGPVSAHGTAAIRASLATSTDRITAAFSDYDTVSEQVPYVTSQLSFQNYIPCVDLPYISSLGAFIHALLSRAYFSDN